MSDPLPPSPEDQSAGERLAATISGDVSLLMQGESKRRGSAAVLSVVASVGLLVFFLVRARASIGDRLLPVVAASAILAAGVAVSAVLRMRKMTPALLGVSVLAGVLFSAHGSDHGWYAYGGVECAAIEWLFALVTAAPATWAMTKNADPIDPWRVAAWTALGGGIGAACLWICCAARDALEHALVFHAGAMIVAVMLTSAWAMRRR